MARIIIALGALSLIAITVPASARTCTSHCSGSGNNRTCTTHCY